MTIEHAPSDTQHRLDDEYDDSVPPLWQSVIDLGASLPPDRFSSARSGEKRSGSNAVGFV
jgi:hypothetical protein